MKVKYLSLVLLSTAVAAGSTYSMDKVAQESLGDVSAQTASEKRKLFESNLSSNSAPVTPQRRGGAKKALFTTPQKPVAPVAHSPKADQQTDAPKSPPESPSESGIDSVVKASLDDVSASGTKKLREMFLDTESAAMRAAQAQQAEKERHKIVAKEQALKKQREEEQAKRDAEEAEHKRIMADLAESIQNLTTESSEIQKQIDALQASIALGVDLSGPLPVLNSPELEAKRVELTKLQLENEKENERMATALKQAEQELAYLNAQYQKENAEAERAHQAKLETMKKELEEKNKESQIALAKLEAENQQQATKLAAESQADQESLKAAEAKVLELQKQHEEQEALIAAEARAKEPLITYVGGNMVFQTRPVVDRSPQERLEYLNSLPTDADRCGYLTIVPCDQAYSSNKTGVFMSSIRNFLACLNNTEVDAYLEKIGFRSYLQAKYDEIMGTDTATREANQTKYRKEMALKASQAQKKSEEFSKRAQHLSERRQLVYDTQAYNSLSEEIEHAYGVSREAAEEARDCETKSRTGYLNEADLVVPLGTGNSQYSSYGNSPSSSIGSGYGYSSPYPSYGYSYAPTSPAVVPVSSFFGGGSNSATSTNPASVVSITQASPVQPVSEGTTPVNTSEKKKSSALAALRARATQNAPTSSPNGNNGVSGGSADISADPFDLFSTTLASPASTVQPVESSVALSPAEPVTPVKSVSEGTTPVNTSEKKKSSALAALRARAAAQNEKK